MLTELIKTFRKLVLNYSRASGLSKADTVDLLIPGILAVVEKALRDSIKTK